MFDSALPTIHVRKETRQLIEKEAESRDMSIADIMRMALDEFIRSHALKTVHGDNKCNASSVTAPE